MGLMVPPARSARRGYITQGWGAGGAPVSPPSALPPGASLLSAQGCLMAPQSSFRVLEEPPVSLGTHWGVWGLQGSGAPLGPRVTCCVRGRAQGRATSRGGRWGVAGAPEGGRVSPATVQGPKHQQQQQGQSPQAGGYHGASLWLPGAGAAQIHQVHELAPRPRVAHRAPVRRSSQGRGRPGAGGAGLPAGAFARRCRGCGHPGGHPPRIRFLEAGFQGPTCE